MEKDTRRDGLHSTVEENTRGEKMQRGILGEDRWRNELYRGRRYTDRLSDETDCTVERDRTVGTGCTAGEDVTRWGDERHNWEETILLFTLYKWEEKNIYI